MSLGRADVGVLLAAWVADSAVLRVELHLAIVSAAFSARIISASPDRVHLLSDDKWSECVLIIPASAAFGYNDLRDFPTEAEDFERLIVISPGGSLLPTEDYIVLGEIKSEK